MKTLKPVLMVLAILMGLLVCETAWARPGGGHYGGGGHAHGSWHGGGGGHYYYHGHGGGRGYWRGGIFIGAPLGWYGDPFYDPFYRYYDVERSVWYYCDNPRGYYPQVLECAVPWRVLTSPPLR